MHNFLQITTCNENKSNFIGNMKIEDIIKKTQSAVQQFTTWLKLSPRFERNKIPPSKLDNFEGSFLLSIRKADGSKYEPDTLTTYHRSPEWKEISIKKYLYSLVNDKEYLTSRAVLQSKRNAPDAPRLICRSAPVKETLSGSSDQVIWRFCKNLLCNKCLMSYEDFLFWQRAVTVPCWIVYSIKMDLDPPIFFSIRSDH